MTNDQQVSSDPIRAALIERVNEDFTYHPPPDDVTRALHDELTRRSRDLSIWMARNLPVGRHLSLALTAAEELRMRGNQAIAIGRARPAHPPEGRVMTDPDSFDPEQYLQEYRNAIQNCEVRLAGELTGPEREHVVQYKAELETSLTEAEARLAEQARPAG